MMEAKEPYGISFEITYQQCSRCGAVHIPNNDYNPDCAACQQVKIIHELAQLEPK